MTLKNALVEMTSKRSKGEKGRLANTNTFRNQYVCLLRTLWHRLPGNHPSLYPKMYSIPGIISFEEVVTAIAQKVHKFIFFEVNVVYVFKESRDEKEVLERINIPTVKGTIPS